MKKIIIPFMLALTSSMANAEYTLIIPLEKAQGGQLPNGSIRITSNWTNAPTAESEWLDQGHPYDCNNWFPADSTMPMGETFTQTATDCSQDQTRTVQDQEIETISGIVRDKGEPYTKSQTIIVSSTRDSVGTLETWESFANEKVLPTDWNNLSWINLGLSHTPNAPYPITSVNVLNLNYNKLTNVNGLSNLTSVNTLNLSNNQLKNVDGLSNLTSVDSLHLGTNQLTNVDRLSNLTSVDTLGLNNNQLTNVDGLSNLTIVNKTLFLNSNQLTNVNGLSNLTSVYHLNLNYNKLTNVNGLSNLTSVNTLNLANNQLTNVDGLANVKVSYKIITNYSGPKKLAANTRFCTENPTSVFEGAQKTQLCESP